MTALRRSMTGWAGSLSFLPRLPRDRRPLLQRQNGGSRTETRGSALGCGRHCSPGAPIAWPSSTTLLQRRCAASVDFSPGAYDEMPWDRARPLRPQTPRSTGTTPYIQLLLLWVQTSFATNLECLMVRFKGVSSTSNGPSPSYNKISTPN